MVLSPTTGSNLLEGQVLQSPPPSMSLKIGTLITFGITCSVATIFMALRYVQAFKLTKKIEIDLGMIRTTSRCR